MFHSEPSLMLPFGSAPGIGIRRVSAWAFPYSIRVIEMPDRRCRNT
jgi:hypothetical protein